MSGTQDQDTPPLGQQTVQPPPPPPPPPPPSGQSGQSVQSAEQTGQQPAKPPVQPVQPDQTGNQSALPTGPTFSVDGQPPAPTPQDSKKEEPEEDEQKISAAREMLSDFADEIHASKDDSIKKGMQILMMLLFLLLLMLLMILFGMGKVGKRLGEKLIDAIKDKFKDDPETVKQLNALKKALKDGKLGDELDKRLVDCLTDEQRKQYEALSEPGKFEFLERLKQEMGILPNNQDAIKALISELHNARKNPDVVFEGIQRKADAIFTDPSFKERDVVGKDVCVTFGTEHSADDEVTAAYKNLSYEQKLLILSDIEYLRKEYPDASKDRGEPDYSASGKANTIDQVNSYPEGVRYIRERIKGLALENTPMTSFDNPYFGADRDLSRSVSNPIYGSSVYEGSVDGGSDPRYEPLNPRVGGDYEELDNEQPDDGRTQVLVNPNYESVSSVNVPQGGEPPVGGQSNDGQPVDVDENGYSHLGQHLLQESHIYDTLERVKDESLGKPEIKSRDRTDITVEPAFDRSVVVNPNYESVPQGDGPNLPARSYEQVPPPLPPRPKPVDVTQENDYIDVNPLDENVVELYEYVPPPVNEQQPDDGPQGDELQPDGVKPQGNGPTVGGPTGDGQQQDDVPTVGVQKGEPQQPVDVKPQGNGPTVGVPQEQPDDGRGKNKGPQVAPKPTPQSIAAYKRKQQQDADFEAEAARLRGMDPINYNYTPAVKKMHQEQMKAVADTLREQPVTKDTTPTPTAIVSKLEADRERQRRQFSFDNLEDMFRRYDDIQGKNLSTEQKWQFVQDFKTAVENVNDAQQYKEIKQALVNHNVELLTQVGTEKQLYDKGDKHGWDKKNTELVNASLARHATRVDDLFSKTLSAIKQVKPKEEDKNKQEKKKTPGNSL
jgi:hypothetical protein